MPSVRWKSITTIVTTVLLSLFAGQADGTDGMQHPISMGADGWKPILGSNRPSSNTHYQEEIKYYQNPILKETVKAEPLPTTTPSGTTPGNSTRFDQKAMKTISINVVHPYSKGKLPPHSKHAPQYYVLPNHGSHGPHIPLNAVMHRNPNQHKKNHGHNSGKRIKKPGYGQMVTAHSTRNEVYVPAPSPGSYSFFTQGKNVKTRESAGLSNEGQKIYIKHPHVEFSSHFPPNNVYQQGNQPIQHIIFQKQQVNEIIPSYQVDNLQNLSPPPIYKNFNEANQGQQQNDLRTNNDKVILGHNPLGPNDLLLQLPSYDIFGFGKQRVQNPNIQVTREKLQHFQQFPTQNLVQVEGEFGQINHVTRRPVTDYPKQPTYEVTEGKWEENTSSSDHIHSHVELDVPPFLPTPYRPDKVFPTSPTQNEVSTIFGQLSNVVKQHPEVYTRNSLFFDVKEVSTHYPILGKPGYLPTTEPTPQETTEKPSSRPFVEEVEKTTEWEQQTTEQPVKIQSHRRRRPTMPRTTTPVELLTDPISVETTTPPVVSMEVETERPYRPRRPLRPRPSSSEETHRVRDRHRKRPGHNRKRVRPNRYESEEYTTNKPTEESKEVTEVLPIIQYFTTQSSFRGSQEEQKETQESQVEDQTERVRPLRRRPYNRESSTSEDTSGERVTESPQPSYISSYEIASQEEEETLQNHDSSRITEDETNVNDIKNYSTTTTEAPTTLSTINIPENEVEYTTQSIPEEMVLVDQKTPKVTTTSEPTTTSTTTAPTKSHRRRPIKYNASSRPRFSVKDYRQRLNQYSSTSTTSTEGPKPVSDNTVRLRFPTRLRRPLSTTSTTTQVYEETTRFKFVPKEPRYSSTLTSSNDVITEKNVKAVNTRLRPFGRTKTTTESSPVTSKISIKPHLFSNRRRPQVNPLKTRIQNSSRTNDIETKTENPNEYEEHYETTTPKLESIQITEERIQTEEKEEEEATTIFPTLDILKNDAFAYSQRVSDLTSSMKDEYERFKAIPSSSRRVPNHYTISTEDPVLPLEAFFSNINDKGK